MWSTVLPLPCPRSWIIEIGSAVCTALQSCECLSCVFVLSTAYCPYVCAYSMVNYWLSTTDISYLSSYFVATYPCVNWSVEYTCTTYARVTPVPHRWSAFHYALLTYTRSTWVREAAKERLTQHASVEHHFSQVDQQTSLFGMHFYGMGGRLYTHRVLPTFRVYNRPPIL